MFPENNQFFHLEVPSCSALLQVLVAVPQRFCRSIFLGDQQPGHTIRESIRLYAPVFCKWLQGAAPCLDLRDANLHLLDWSRLFSFLENVPEVSELHVRGEEERKREKCAEGPEGCYTVSEVRCCVLYDRSLL